MKRNLILAGLCLLCALLLIGCGSSSPAATPAPTETAAPAESSAPAESAAPVETEVPAETPAPSAEPEPSAEPVATLPDAGLVRDKGEDSNTDELYEIAQSFMEKPVSELIDAIGQPISSAYAGFSCLIPGGDDGELYYDGFVVSTVKSGDSETVINVSRDAHISP